MSRERPNVLLITCDALRADHVGSARGRPSLTPHLDQLAQSGVVFETAISQGFRTPISMPSLFTGRYPSRLQWFTVASPFALRRQVRGVLMGEEPTLAELLAARGYDTAGIHSNPLLTRLFGYQRGFGLFDDDLFLADSRLPPALRRWAFRLPQLVRVTSHAPAPRINRTARAWLDRARHPFFLWLHYMDTHGPYRSYTGSGWLERVRAQVLYQRAVSRPASVTPAERDRLLRWYAAEVRYVDAHIGALLGGLAADGRLDDTLVIVTADHGEEFGDHGRYNHHSTLYEELLRVPLVMRLPGAAHAGAVVRAPVGLVQVVPTILDVVGGRVPAGLDGVSLRELLANPAAAPSSILSEAKPAPRYKAALRRGAWKLIADAGRASRELYDLEADALERHNLAEDRPDVADALEHELQRLLETTGGEREAPAAEMDPATTERLRDLGYL